MAGFVSDWFKKQKQISIQTLRCLEQRYISIMLHDREIFI